VIYKRRNPGDQAEVSAAVTPTKKGAAMPEQNTPDPRHGATHSMEYADRAHSDISAKISRLTWGMGEDDARRMAGPMLLASAYAEIERLTAKLHEAQSDTHEFRTPDRVGWWWVRTADSENLDGFRPVWVSDRDPWPAVSDFGFFESCRGCWVSVSQYSWAGLCVFDEAGS